MTIERPHNLPVRTFVVGACAAILAWLVISTSLAAYLADVAPYAALRLNSRESEALVNLADRTLNAPDSSHGSGVDAATPEPGNADDAAPGMEKKTDANGQNPTFSAFDVFDQRPGVDLPTIRALLMSSLAGDPLNSRAMRILGQAAGVARDSDKASKFMNAAAHLSLHDRIAVYWLVVNSAEARDYDATLYYADVFLRTAPELGEFVLPILAHIAEDKSAAGPLKTLLISNPPWRGQFFERLPYGVTDERTPLELLLALRTSPDPPTSEDVNHFLNYLVAHKFYNLAYYTWLQFLPADGLRNAGFLYNGNFESPPSGSPFDWHIAQGSGVTVDVEAKPGDIDDHALVLNFEYGRVEYQSVTQLIKLTPGRYQFKGRHKGELAGPRGLKWRVSCAESPTDHIAESEMIIGRASAWSDSEFAFGVPEQNCRAQYLSLDLDARMPSEQFITGIIWFDDLRISRIEK